MLIRWVMQLLTGAAIIRKICQRRTCMKHYRMILAVTALVLASLACQAVMGGGSDNVNDAPSSSDGGAQPEMEQPDAEAATEAPAAGDSSSSSETTVSTSFPMTDDAYNVVEAGGSLIYYTKLSADDALEFYRDEYESMGYVEREILTTTGNGMFSVVFDGDPGGKAVVIQSVDLGDGSRTIAIRFEDI